MLGPLEVVVDGAAVELGPPKQRAVLAALLLEPDRVVSVDRLVDAVWGGEPPGSAVAGLQVYVSNLRRLLRSGGQEGTPLVRRPPGYVLSVAADQVDVTEFLSAADDARAAASCEDWVRAVDDVRRALAVWRGPVLTELRDLPWVAVAAAGLDERRSECRELLVRALLALGRLGDALGHAQLLVTDHPFSEPARWLHLRALHLAGRSADALEGYRQYARMLADELGLEPGAELRELHTGILRQDPALRGWAAAPLGRPAPSLPSTAPSPAPAGVGLVGRDKEAGVVQQVVDAVVAGRTSWLVLTGPPGIGKTRLAEEAAARMRAAGGRDVWGRCPEEDGVPAWWPLRQVVRSLGADPDDLLVPPAGVDADGARFAVYERVLALVQDGARREPLVVVVDDVHWADGTSLRCLAYLAGALRESAVGFVLTARDGEGTAEVQAVYAALARRDGAVQLAVPPLDAGAVISLVGEVAGEEVPEAEARVLTARTGGNPLFVSEYARLPRSERVGTAIPVAVRAVLGRRLSRLSDEVLSVLRTAAVAGDVLDVDLLASATGLPVEDLADRLDQAAGERIITEFRGEGDHAFAHGLLREEVLAQLSAPRRQRLHARLAEVLAGRGQDSDTVTRRAQHLVAALPLVDAQLVVDACCVAAQDAESRWDSDAAAQWWGQALAALDRLPSAEDGRRDDLLVARLTALARSGRGQTVLDEVDAELVAAARAGRTGTIGRLAGVLLRSSGGWPWVTYGRDPGVVQARLSQLTDRLGTDPTALVRVLAARAVGSCYHPDPGVPDDLSRRALALAEELAEPEVMADALVGRVLTYVGVAEHAEEALSLVDRLVLLDRQESPVDEVLRHNVRTMACVLLGDVAAAEESVRRGIAGCDLLRLPVMRVQLRWAEAMLAQWRGELSLAAALVDRAIELHQQTELYESGVYDLGRLSVLWDQGRLAERLDLVPRSPTPLVWGAAAAAQAGDRAAAHRLLDEAVPVEGPFFWDTLGHQVLLAHVVADLGAVEHAATLVDRLTPRADHIAIIGQVGVTGPVSLALGRLHALLGDRDAAAEHLAASAEQARQCGGRTALLRTELAQAQLSPSGPVRDAELTRIAAQARDIGMLAVAAAAGAMRTPSRQV